MEKRREHEEDEFSTIVTLTPVNNKMGTLSWATASRVECENSVRDYVGCTNKRLQVHLWR